jgi:hypothetical protein
MKGPASPSPTYAGELRARDAVAVSDDLAARDLGSVGDQRLELLVADPGRDDVRGLFALLGCFEETKRAEDAVTGLDQVVARKSAARVRLAAAIAQRGCAQSPVTPEGRTIGCK